MAVVVRAATELDVVGPDGELAVAPTAGAAASIATSDAASASPINLELRAAMRGACVTVVVAEDARWAPAVERSKARASCLPDVALTTRRRWSMPPGQRQRKATGVNAGRCERCARSGCSVWAERVLGVGRAGRLPGRRLRLGLPSGGTSPGRVSPASPAASSPGLTIRPRAVGPVLDAGWHGKLETSSNLRPVSVASPHSPHIRRPG